MKTRHFTSKGFRLPGRGFTLLELLVVIAIVAVLAAIILPVLGRAKEKARAVQCLSNIKQWGTAMIVYADENEDYIPREGFRRDGQVRRDNWAQVRDPLSKDVWYNNLPTYLNQRPASSYASALAGERQEFYKNHIFHCPSARFPTYAATDNSAYFSLVMNSKLIQGPTEASTASIRFSSIIEPSQTVLFLEARVNDGEMKTHYLQLDTDLGQPAGFASRFAARHRNKGNLAFGDGHVSSFRGAEIIETRSGYSCGLGIFPGGPVFWRPDPLDDPNLLD